MVNEVAALNPTKRFSNRVENYVKYRPTYPADIVPFFEKTFCLQTDQRIADIGSGTGLFAELLLEKGFRVTCIEPNNEMRKAAETKLGHFKGFSSRRYRAEHTGLKSDSVDLITVAQAFHWMNPVAAKTEFQRILKPGGHIVLAWNIKQTNTPFLQAFDELKHQFAIDEQQPERINEAVIELFFSPAVMKLHCFQNTQWLNFDALKGQLLSSSYIPLPGHESYDAMISALVKLFVDYNENGSVKMDHETKLYYYEA
ncbi:MAG: class I SAM-dependent methyltransferase [Chitinophagaceae bacterium]